MARQLKNRTPMQLTEQENRKTLALMTLGKSVVMAGSIVLVFQNLV